jgi:hypothetical protein
MHVTSMDNFQSEYSERVGGFGAYLLPTSVVPTHRVLFAVRSAVGSACDSSEGLAECFSFVVASHTGRC